MALNKPWSTLCFLTLSLPAIGFSSPFWFFSSTPDNCSKTEARVEDKCSVKCDEMKCEKPKSCCETKTITEVVTVCEDPCHPKHCDWEAVLSLGIGYRHDRLTQKLSPNTNSGASNWRSKYRGISSVLGVLRFDARVKNFMFGFEGDYAPEVGGTLEQNFTFPNDSSSNTHYKFRKLSGYETDAQLTVGYRLEFINGRHGRAYFIPQVGYRYSHQAWETYSQDDYVNRGLNDGNVRNFLQDQSPMHSEWFGPFLEAKLSFVFWNHMHVDPYYQYHFLDHRTRKRVAETSITIDPNVVGAPATQQTITTGLIDNDNARGQSAGIDFYWQFDNQFRLGAKGTWTRFETERARGHVKEKTTTFATNPPATTITHLKENAHTGWTSYTAYIYGGYSF